MSSSTLAPVGAQLRRWREQRRLSQLALSMEADVSTRHLSFVETGRSLPSREMLLRLADRLDVPLRARNDLLTAAGYAPMYVARPLADPAMAAARHVVEHLLRAHEPYPALAVDRHWTIVLMNRAVGLLMEGVPPALAGERPNALRVSLHPQGLAPRIVNLDTWRAHLLARLHQQVVASGDATLAALETELTGYAHRANGRREEPSDPAIVVPLVIDTRHGRLSFISTTTVFGTPIDVTLSELALETFLPADAATAAALRQAFDASVTGG